MRYWNTGDTPTNSNLASIENLARPWAGIGAEHLLDVIRGVIRIEKMLPKAVQVHFNLPPLFVGNAPYDWDAARREEYHNELCAALSEGLSRVQADPTLVKNGGADLSDRPPTRGEELEFACRAWSRDRTSSNLDDLRIACNVQGMQSRFDKLERWLGRKRPGSSPHSVAYEIECALGDIERYADTYHSMEASYRFAERLRERAQLAEEG
ncbi:MAG: hypothetical protein U0S50_08845 [Sphingopyxis sp.]|uniref:hypothetical protein n=1 Tax=Sphingopyxis sp. TaxID=1908224 RepID=UPI002ABB7AC5|nr:hypothetical protein [Sphingopyxis sp.]MDZ3831907.1 hypothetical protein [Sphingopyxis sp.]